MSGADTVIDAGFSKPITNLTLADRDEVIHIIALHHTILKCKAELDDLKNGLGALGVGDMLKYHPDILQSFLTTGSVKPITAGMHNNKCYAC